MTRLRTRRKSIKRKSVLGALSPSPAKNSSASNNDTSKTPSSNNNGAVVSSPSSSHTPLNTSSASTNLSVTSHYTPASSDRSTLSTFINYSPEKKKTRRKKRKRVALDHSNATAAYESSPLVRAHQHTKHSEEANSSSLLRSKRSRTNSSPALHQQQNAASPSEDIASRTINLHSNSPSMALKDASHLDYSSDKMIHALHSTPVTHHHALDPPSSLESSYSFGSPFVTSSPLRMNAVLFERSGNPSSGGERQRYQFHRDSFGEPTSQESNSEESKSATTPCKDNESEKENQETHNNASSTKSSSLCAKCGLNLHSSALDHSILCTRMTKTLKIPKNLISSSLCTLREESLSSSSLSSLQIYQLNLKRKKAQQIFELINDLLLYSDEDESEAAERYKLFVCMDLDLVVGAVIVEQISTAYRTKSRSNRSPSVLSQKDVFEYDARKKEKAVLGISRIWVDERYRRRQIASNLVDCSRKHAIGGYNCSKDMIAFTQPTENGKRFAMNYCERDYFLVYGVRKEEMKHL